LPRLFCSVWTCNQFCRFQENGSSLFQAMLAHALLDSNAFAMAFSIWFFQQDDKYLRYVYGRGGHGSSISSSNFFASDIKRYINFRIPHFSISCLNGCFSGEFGAYPLLVRLPLLVLEKSF
jgi:hypothetical protein